MIYYFICVYDLKLLEKVKALMQNEKPLISIGVSAYNRADYLPYCLDSLLGQSYPNCEIIVIDDGSTDGTAELMREKYPQIRYVRQPNGGDASAKNHAAQLAQGKYIVFNDSDDVFLPDAVERLYEALPDGEENACSYGTYISIDTEGKQLQTKRKMAHNPSGNITGDLLKHIVVNNCGTLVPLELFRQKGGFDSSKRVSYDWGFFLDLSLECSFYAVSEPVFLRRRHGGNLSSASYSKLSVTWGIFEEFVAAHPELEEKYSDIIRRRRADFHSKLRREAAREKLSDKAKYHAREAFKNHHTLKNFFRMIF